MLRNICRLSFIFIGASASLWSEEAANSGVATLDLAKVFNGSPIIYTVLLLLSMFSFVVWLYSLLTLRITDMMPEGFINQIREQLAGRRFEAALKTCQQDNHFSAQIIASGLSARKHGSQVMMEAMQSEGRRGAMTLWQRISLINDVAVVAPMLGLLGTVLGMFFAFYDTNRTAESLTAIFDGLGIAIGTTVAGLVVATLAMIFYTTLKFRITTLLNTIENESLTLINLIETEQSQTVPQGN